MVHCNQGRSALCFPGQLQRVPEGVGEQRGGDYSLPHPFLKKTREKIGFHLPSFSFPKRKENDCLNLKLQVASYLLSMVSFDRYRRGGGRWDLITEHSMGIYAALAAAGAMTFEDGLEMVKGIGIVLEEMGRKRPGGMATVIGLGREEMDGICQDVDDGLYVANLNASRHFVISGEVPSVKRGLELALKRGAISAQHLTFNAPLHSPLMEPIREKVRQLLGGFRINAPHTPLVCHWGGRPLSGPDEIREFLVEELCRPVDWEGCVRSLLAQGVTHFVEVGPSDTLTKLIRWIDRDVKAVSYGVRDVI
ncbi:MAG: ACP S-malonyltransferase [Deltaproteobacteria bacterium]|nr:ACP S-malonyltransferase [Deltaproteobacteria bacterium]